MIVECNMITVVIMFQFRKTSYVVWESVKYGNERLQVLIFMWADYHHNVPESCKDKDRQPMQRASLLRLYRVQSGPFLNTRYDLRRSVF
jgi:hypothetical protein